MLVCRTISPVMPGHAEAKALKLRMCTASMQQCRHILPGPCLCVDTHVTALSALCIISSVTLMRCSAPRKVVALRALGARLAA